MSVFTVTTPASGHSGTVGKVTFVDGSAVVDGDTHPAELAYFRAQGYGVAENAPATVDELDALRAEAVELGLKVHHAAKAETIRKQIDEARAAPSADDESGDQAGDDEEIQS